MRGRGRFNGYARCIWEMRGGALFTLGLLICVESVLLATMPDMWWAVIPPALMTFIPAEQYGDAPVECWWHRLRARHED
jgi:hypothetical protein